MKKLAVTLLIILVFVTTVTFGAEKKNKVDYPSFMVHKSVTICINSVIHSILRTNPGLRSQPVPLVIINRISSHCSCVMDLIRAKFTHQDYLSSFGDLEQIWTSNAAECNVTGHSLDFSDVPSEQKVIVVEQLDNKTVEQLDNKTVEEEPLLPEEEEEEVDGGQTGTIFSG